MDLSTLKSPEHKSAAAGALNAVRRIMNNPFCHINQDDRSALDVAAPEVDANISHDNLTHVRERLPEVVGKESAERKPCKIDKCVDEREKRFHANLSLVVRSTVERRAHQTVWTELC